MRDCEPASPACKLLRPLMPATCGAASQGEVTHGKMPPASQLSGESPGTIKASASSRALANVLSNKGADPAVAGTRRPLEELLTALRKVSSVALSCLVEPGW